MDYGRPALTDRLAAEYVLGTLRGPARRRMDTLLPAHPALRQAVSQWQQRLAPLSSSVQPVAPSPAVWRAIEQRLFMPAAADRTPHTPSHTPSYTPTPTRWWQALALWRGLATVASVAAVALLVQVTREPAAQAPLVVVLAATPEAALALNASAAASGVASFVASISADGRALVLQPTQATALVAGRALELWAVPAQGAPRSLGLVRADGSTTVLRAQLLRDTAAFAVSVEPTGGSPTGAPTGPIVSVGKLQI